MFAERDDRSPPQVLQTVIARFREPQETCLVNLHPLVNIYIFVLVPQSTYSKKDHNLLYVDD